MSKKETIDLAIGHQIQREGKTYEIVGFTWRNGEARVRVTEVRQEVQHAGA